MRTCVSTVAHHNRTEPSRLTGPLPLLLLFVVVCAVALAVAIHHGWRPKESRDANIAVTLSSRLQTAKILADSGQFAAAQEQLAPLLKDSRSTAFREARWLSWQLQWEQAMGLPTGSAARAAAWKALSTTYSGHGLSGRLDGAGMADYCNPCCRAGRSPIIGKRLGGGGTIIS